MGWLHFQTIGFETEKLPTKIDKYNINMYLCRKNTLKTQIFLIL